MITAALLWKPLDRGEVQCGLCAHRCRIRPGTFGRCGVRENKDGTLVTHAYGEVIAAYVDPVEKKPLYHFLPGSKAFSIATIGCNFKCGFCQNWQISQASYRDHGNISNGHQATPASIVDIALQNHCASIAYTYTEPTIFFEYAFDTARLAKEKGMRNIFVTNGYMTPEALEMAAPVLDAANVDLKSFRDAYYRKNCKAQLEPVLETIRGMKARGIWVEVTTLIIPGENDSDEELEDTARFIAGVGVDIPWHLSRFHPDYEFLKQEATPVETLRRAREIGQRCGLRHVYLGNVLEGSDTCCPQCKSILVRRYGYEIESAGILHARCRSCGAAVDGVFES